ncbi:hypothetical protein DTL42_19250 [Bremerella cremea]|uniref:Uncharacterized protein n=1 Tax=Bremerella cremea TaxID=1031537 RepID=A0A368KM25_9BACT|nr:hypothetical protein [Bremerella cremea]RCS42279.1 hypothetical protein DTL42_19250 [Bremerella cremea]
MSPRRSLVTGLSETPNVTEQEKKFVFGSDDESMEPITESKLNAFAKIDNSQNTEEVLPQYRGRVPLTTRCDPKLASALKRASLKRQLEGLETCQIQEIIEEAVETWLKEHGYY